MTGCVFKTHGGDDVREKAYRMARNTEIESGGREQRDKFIIVKFGVNTLLYLKIVDIIIYTVLIINK